MYGFSNGENSFDLRLPLKSRSNPEDFEVEYLKNGLKESVYRSEIGSHVWAFEW